MRDWASVLHSNDLLERRLPLAPASRPQLRSGDQVPNKKLVNTVHAQGINEEMCTCVRVLPAGGR